MDLQKKVIDDVMATHNRPTLKRLSEMTGIQLTRIFRIMNGAEMKLTEYQAFSQCLGAEKQIAPSTEKASYHFMERVMIESLGRGAKSIAQLIQDTGLLKENIEDHLRQLIKRGECCLIDEQYGLSEKGKSNSLYRSRADKRKEAIDFFANFFDRSLAKKGPVLKLTKIWMSACDQMLFQQLLDDLDAFLLRVHKSNREAIRRGQKMPLNQQMVLLLGNSHYADLMSPSTLPISC